MKQVLDSTVTAEVVGSRELT